MAKWYTIKASITVDVDIDVSADDKDAALRKFHDHICMTASLVDVAPDDVSVTEDSISDVAIESVDEAPQ